MGEDSFKSESFYYRPIEGQIKETLYKFKILKPKYKKLVKIEEIGVTHENAEETERK